MNETVGVEELFGSKVFTRATMRERLPKNVYREVIKVTEEGGELTLQSADVIAKAMKDWAVENGATHYTHWFQPLTGITAEKHDSFVTHPDADGKMLMEFSGKELIKGEPDASSFPSGGLRATFEARGYTTWDITSPAFIKETATGPTLCIPTAFCSYTGEALDKKTPLLRSMEALSKQAVRLVRLFGNTEAKKVIPSVGAEQEYFLVDQKKALQREDIIFSGRTLFGAPAPKGQEMDDHYFGVIRERIGAFMETLKRVAGKHGLRCLLHEKPFAGVNGSGKHNNWSITTDNGVNLLEPGQTPNENIQFLLVIACIMKAVDTHADLLRQSASNVGNDHRLGGFEAPPAIISIFLGEQLEDVVEQLVETGKADSLKKGGILKTGVSTLPDFVKDATDRNRTSPFAFTGNKFEFRSVGSEDSIGSPNTTLNAIVAEAFCEAADRLENAEDFDLAVHDLIKEYMTEHQRIIFNGNGYAKEWEEEAARRGLPNIPSMVEAVGALTTEKSIRLFEKFGIFTEAELRSRAEILYETYAKTINIEALTMLDMADKQIIPAVIRFAGTLADTAAKVKGVGGDASVMEELLKNITAKLSEMKKAADHLEKEEKKASSMERGKEQAFFYHDVVMTSMSELRKPADELEKLVDKEYWPFPTYAELLFEV